MNARIARRLTAVALALGLLALGAGPAVAASSTPSPAPSAGKQITVPANNLTFAVATSDGRTNDGRQIFRFAAKPGETITDHIVVYNLGRVKGTFAAYAIDAVTGTDGAFTLATLTDKQSGLGQWTRMGVTFFTLAGGESRVIPFTITVPRNAIPGDTVGGVVVSDVPRKPEITSIQQQLAVATRVGVRTVVRVQGDLRSGLEVSGLTTSFEASPTTPGFGRLTASWTVTNTGNVRVAAEQKLAVQALLGGTITSQDRPRLEQILPGTSVQQTVVLDGVLAGLRLTTTVDATPVVLEGDVPASAAATASDSVWAISWIAVGLVTLIVGLATALVLRLRGRRRSSGPSGGAHGSGSDQVRATAGVPA